MTSPPNRPTNSGNSSGSDPDDSHNDIDALLQIAAEVTPPVAVTVIRVSYLGGRDKGGKSGGGQFISPDDQLARGKAYAHARGWYHDDALSLANADIDVSAFTTTYHERPGLQRHLTAARIKAAQHFIIPYVDRIAKHIDDGLAAVKAIQAAGAEVHFVDIATPIDEEEGQLSLELNLLVNAVTARRQSARARSNMLKAAEMGVIGYRPPLWIEKVKHPLTGKNEYYLSSVWAPAFRRMMELRLEWKGYHSIAKELNAEGYTTFKGSSWIDSVVEHYLSPKFIRMMRGEAHYIPKKKVGKTVPEAIWKPDIFPALITEEESKTLATIAATLGQTPSVLAGKATRAANFAEKRTRGAAPDTNYLLTSRIFCPYCGAKMVSHRSIGRKGKAEEGEAGNRESGERYVKTFYRCRCSDIGKSSACVTSQMAEDAVIRTIEFAIEQYQKEKYERGLQKPRKRVSAATDRPVRKVAPRIANRTLEDVETEIKRLLHLSLSGRVKGEDYDAAYERLDGERTHLRQAEIEANLPDIMGEALRVLPEKGADINDEEVRRKWRQSILLLVERIEAPVEMPDGALSVYDGPPPSRTAQRSRTDGRRNRNGDDYTLPSGEARPAAKVILRFQTEKYGGEFLAPLYRKTYTARRELFYTPKTEEVEPGRAVIVGT